MEDLKFNISEIFYSLQGEGTRAGLPCVFVRLQGCELRCSWCDTEYALDLKKKELMLNGKQIFEKVSNYDCNFVTFTGGEPLMQKSLIPLMSFFCDKGFTVALETNGHQDISEIDSRVIKIMDLKCPGSEMSKNNRFGNIKFLTKNDEIKFVIANRADFEWAKEIIQKYSLAGKVAAILFSPVFGSISAEELAQWILDTHLPFRFQLQLHKFIWGQNTRGV